MVIDAGPGGVGVGVGSEQGHTVADERVDDFALGGVGGHAGHAAQQQRVVDDQHVGAGGHGSIGDFLGAVQGQEDRVGGTSRVAANETNLVPAFRKVGWVGTIQNGDRVGNGGHVSLLKCGDEGIYLRFFSDGEPEIVPS